MIFLNRQQGVALLEVLIAFVIVTISVVALYQLQNIFLRNEITSSARLTALHIAESKLDDLRTFSSLSSVSAGIPAYDDIDDNMGGVIASGAISSDNAHNVGNFVYNLSWDVTPQNGSRDVTVTVSWTDNNGIEQIQLFGNVTPAQRINKDRLAYIGKMQNDKPIVTYNPDDQDVAPTVIPIVLGDSGSIKATTRPLPDIGKNGSNTYVQFDSVTYNSSDNTQALDDFVTLSCDCSYIDSGTTLTPAKPYIADGDLLYWQVGSSVNKKQGASTKSALCTVCCENHFDVEVSPSFDEVYNRLNPEAEKYNIIRDGSEYVYSSTPVTTLGGYVDSCRLMRIDGYYKPMPDWNLVKLIVMDSYFLDKLNPKYAANLENYQKYVAYVVKEYALWLHGNVTDNPLDITNDSPVLSIYSFNEWLSSGDLSVNENGETLNISMEANETKQLISRGIFIDVLSQDLMSEELGLFAENGSISEDYLSKIPFYDVNMTKLTRWHPNKTDDDTSYISVTSAPMSDLNSSDEYYGVYSRGTLTTGSTVKDEPITVTAEAYPGNSSIAAYQPDAKKAEMSVGNSTYDTAIVSESLTVAVTGTPLYRTRGYIYCFDTAKKTCNVAVFDAIADDHAQCEIIPQKLTGNVDYYIYQCATNTETQVAVTFSAPPISSTQLSTYLPESVSKTTTTSLQVTHGGCVVFYQNTMSLPAITCPETTP